MNNNFIISSDNKNSLVEDYAYCEQVIRKYSKSFFYAFSKLPKPDAQAIYAVYAFCRIADDSVDNEPNKESQTANINMMEKALVKFDQENLQHPMWRALKDVFKRYPMRKDPFFEQLEGQKMDINFQQPETLKDLELYSDFVAGSVGRMILPILTHSVNEKVEKSASHLGIAMQLTNILRDVGEDYCEKKRIYLPKDLMIEKSYSEDKLEKGIIDDSFINVWEQVATRSEELYDHFQKQIHIFKRESRLPVLASIYVYRGILNEVRNQRYNCLTKRQSVSMLKKESYYRDAKEFLKTL